MLLLVFRQVSPLKGLCSQLFLILLLKCILKGEHLIFNWQEDRKFQIIFDTAFCNVHFCVSWAIANNLIFTVYTSFSTNPFERWSPIVQNIILILIESHNILNRSPVKQNAWSTLIEQGMPCKNI